MEKEPLTTVEEAVHTYLNAHLKLSDADFARLTDAQKFSAARVIYHQGYGVLRADVIDDYLGISFKHIFIGIEADGYAHS